MHSSMWVDPVVYTENWSCQLPIEIPVMSESDYTMKAVATLGSLLYSDPTLAGLSKRDVGRHIRRILSRISTDVTSNGLIPTIERYKDIGHSLLTNLGWSDQGQPTFRLIELHMQSPIKGAFIALQRIVDREGSSERAIGLIRWLFTWHNYLAKIPLDRPDLLEPAIAAWVDRQSAFDEELLFREANLILRLEKVMKWLFEYHPGDYNLAGKHGPGNTASDDKTIAAKNAAFRRTPATELVVGQYPTREIAESSIDYSEEQRRAVLKMVKKDSGSLRPITMMPVPLMWLQQIIKEALYSYTVEDHPPDRPTTIVDFVGRTLAQRIYDRACDNPVSEQNFRYFINFADQEKSQQLALAGSSRSDRNSPVTIDLKAASDSIQFDLILGLFSNAEFRDKLRAGRSDGSYIDKQGGVFVEHIMFDGMGSALTFPIQSLLFTAIALLATLEAHWEYEFPHRPDVELREILSEYLRYDGFRNGFDKLAERVQIYGDDIILPRFAADKAVDYIHRLNLHVNQRKSFIKKHEAVREACGIFAVWGQIITPLRFRIPVVNNGGLIDYAAFDAARQHANNLYFAGYKHARRSIIRWLSKTPLLISNDERDRETRLTKVRDFSGKIVDEYKTSYTDIQFVSETSRGPEADYLGFVSDKPNKVFVRNVFYGEGQTCISTICPAAKSTPDGEDEYYLGQQYRLWGGKKSVFFRDHGKIPRGIRFVKRNARIVSARHDLSYGTWEWALSLIHI